MLALNSLTVFARAEIYDSEAHTQRDLSKFDWAARQRDAQNGCILTEHYAAPKMNDNICVADALVTSSCTTSSDPQSSDLITYVAFPLKGARRCTDLIVGRDFFARSAYGKDSYFLPLLRKVSSLLKQEFLSPSVSFKRLGDTAIKEFHASQMSALSGIKLANNNHTKSERYEVSFVLPEISTTIILTLNDDGANPQWGRMLP